MAGAARSSARGGFDERFPVHDDWDRYVRLVPTARVVRVPVHTANVRAFVDRGDDATA